VNASYVHCSLQLSHTQHFHLDLLHTSTLPTMLLLQVMGRLTLAQTADLLAVAGSVLLKGDDDRKRLSNITFSTVLNICGSSTVPLLPAVSQLPAAAVEAQLRLLLQLQARHSKRIDLCYWPIFVRDLCELPGAAQLPAATVVELVQQALHNAGRHMVLVVFPLLELLARVQLTAEQLKGLLSMLQGPTAADTARAYRVRAVSSSIIMWLAMQPGAAAAAAELGLTAADVPDPDAAALLFGSQEAGAADDVIIIDSDGDDDDGGGAGAVGPVAAAAVAGAAALAGAIQGLAAAAQHHEVIVIDSDDE
jgi:hypothetical protein